MKQLFWLVASLTVSSGLVAADPAAAIEERVAQAVQSPKVTVVHFWATWCDNCRTELKSGGWKKIVEANPEVNFVFVTVRDTKPGAPVLATHDLGGQKNFLNLQHPNPSQIKGEELASFLGLRLGWVPATWVYRDGKQRYAINYGQTRFEMLQQMIAESSRDW
ncbi:MAG: hypothetical protein EXS32_12270 [Opitutus sp.]|nr:hypothetical protein [Opitutus sp.]